MDINNENYRTMEIIKPWSSVNGIALSRRSAA
jgi:hypothetical protein